MRGLLEIQEQFVIYGMDGIGKLFTGMMVNLLVTLTVQERMCFIRDIFERHQQVDKHVDVVQGIVVVNFGNLEWYDMIQPTDGPMMACLEHGNRNDLNNPLNIVNSYKDPTRCFRSQLLRYCRNLVHAKQYENKVEPLMVFPN